MGSGLSTSNKEGSGAVGLGDLPENCLAMVLGYLDPSDICNLARVSRAFHRASSADFIWEPKLPENYRNLSEKLMFYGGSSECLGKKDIYAGLCSPVRFSSGTKEVWMEKGGGICMLASWKGMKITGIDDRRYWSHVPSLQSRFHFSSILFELYNISMINKFTFHGKT
ncbi:putative F-box domain-containing protein [Helianthus annuus]|nr:putative F-box domain-containing protein [Helianthus annuus]